MPAMEFRLPGPPPDPATHRKATLRSVDGRLAMTIPYADPETDFADLGQEWATIERWPAGPVTYRRGPKLAKATLRLHCIAENLDGSISHEVMAVKAICDSLSPIVVSYGSLEALMTRSGAWVVTAGHVHVAGRVQGSNDPRWADCELELLEAADFTGTTFTVPEALLESSTPVGRMPATYTVQGGDTLWGIAHQLLGDGNRWIELADLNGIRDPARLQVGTVLRLP